MKRPLLQSVSGHGMIPIWSEPSRAGGSGGAVPRFFLRTRDPDQLTEALAPIAPGSRLEAVSRRGFTANLRAWCFSHVGLLSLQMVDGRALLPGDRGYSSLTVVPASTLLARDDPRTSTIEGDAAHLNEPGEPAEYRPFRGSTVLPANLETSSFAEHMGGRGGKRRGSSARCVQLLSQSAERNSLRRFLDRVFEELSQADSSLHDSRVATEVESVLAAMLAEACAGPAALPGLPADASLRRAEKFLATSLAKPVSLAAAAWLTPAALRSRTAGLSASRRRRHCGADQWHRDRTLQSCLTGSAFSQPVALRPELRQLAQLEARSA